MSVKRRGCFRSVPLSVSRLKRNEFSKHASCAQAHVRAFMVVLSRKKKERTKAKQRRRSRKSDGERSRFLLLVGLKN